MSSKITVAHRMQSAGAAKGAADLVTADGFADMVHHDESGAGGIAQAQQRLAQGGHGAGIIFILIVRGVNVRVENGYRSQDSLFSHGGYPNSW